MRISLVEIKELEEWIFKEGDYPNKLITQAKILTTPGMAENENWQRKAYEIIALYGRKKLEKEIMETERMVFSSPKYTSFQRRILSIFK